MGMVAGILEEVVKSTGATVVLVAMKPGEAGSDAGQDDDAMCRELAGLLPKGSACVVEQRLTPAEMKAVLCQGNALLTMRMHAAILFG